MKNLVAEVELRQLLAKIEAFNQSRDLLFKSLSLTSHSLTQTTLANLIKQIDDLSKPLVERATELDNQIWAKKQLDR